MPTFKDFALLHFLVLIWGFTALLGTLISVPPAEVVFWRTLLAVGLMWPLFARHITKGGLGAAPAWQVAGTGVFIALHWLLFFLAARVGNISSCLAGIATGSVWTALLEPLFERRKVRRSDLASALLVLFGLLIVFAAQADAAAGVALGTASAAFAGLFTICNRRFVLAGANAYAVSTIGLSGALAVMCIILGGQALWVGHAALTGWPVGYDWLWLALLAGVCTVYAFSTSVHLLRKFTAFASTLAVNMEPIYGMLIAYIVLGEREAMSPAFYVGTALVLAAVFGHPWLARRVDGVTG